jgi:methylase of polypeptide subunit release factors
MEPEVDWGDIEQWKDVYSPSSDTFFLCDAIKSLSDRFKPFSLVFEVGTGSGYVSAFTAMHLKQIGKSGFHFGSDINRQSCVKTQSLCSANQIPIGSYGDIFATSFRGPIDVVIFNPPYVETAAEELETARRERGIAASWAGGEDGAVVIYEFLNFITDNRTKFAPDFFAVLLLADINRPSKIKRFCQGKGMEFEVALSKKCQGEALTVVSIRWQTIKI